LKSDSIKPLQGLIELGERKARHGKENMGDCETRGGKEAANYVSGT